MGSNTYSNVKASIERLRNLRFDYLVGCGDDDLGIPYIKLSDKKKAAFFDKIVEGFKS